MRQAVLILLLSCALSAEEPARLTVTTRGTIAFSGTDWWVRVRVEPHPDNRWLEIVADGDGQYRSSSYQLEGEHAAKIHTLWIKQLKEGCYEFFATLRATGEHGRVLARAQGRKLSVRGVVADGDPCWSSEIAPGAAF